MIRHATLADLPDLGRMMKAFNEAANIRIGEFSPLVFEGTCRRLIAHRLSVALVLDRGGAVGMLLAHAAPSPFSADLWADEIAFWIDPEVRGRWALRFLESYEAWGRDVGATVAGLSALDERTETLFRRRGYAPMGRKLVKVV